MRRLIEKVFLKRIYWLEMHSLVGSMCEVWCTHRSTRGVFEKLPVQDIVSWTVLISGYAQHGHGEEALHWTILDRCNARVFLQTKGLTFQFRRRVCGLVGALDKGKELHGEIESMGLLLKDVELGNAFIDAYAKSGSLIVAKHVFEKLPIHNVVLQFTINPIN